MNKGTIPTIGVFLLLALLAAHAAGEAAPAPDATSATNGVVVLSNESTMRAFLAFRTPVYITKEDELKIPIDPGSVPKDPKPLPDHQSPLPPTGWMLPDYDDTSWDRQQLPLEIDRGVNTGKGIRQTQKFVAPHNSTMYLRWKFQVDDPAKAQDLKLALAYVGGAVVYLNGHEVVRGNLPAGEIRADTLAEKYPDDLHCEADGHYLQDVAKNRVAFDRRYRKMELAVPAKFLVKGGNVLAVELHRAPMNEGAVNAKTHDPKDGMYTVRGMWPYVGLKDLALTSTSGEGVAACAARPGIQVWNVGPFETLDVFSRGDPGVPRPIMVHAALNSVFSGRLAVGSDEDIENLKVSVSDLKQTGGMGTLLASAIRVRYAEPAVPEKSWTPPHRFDGLVDAIPARIQVAKVKPPRGMPPTLVGRAVASLWFTVRVPQAAMAGLYEGTVSVSADRLAPVMVPLQVYVNGWNLPDPKDFRQHHLIFLSQDSVAKHYRVPLWSERHFQLMGKSMDLLAEINSREIPMNLARNFYHDLDGNEESMVRWIKQPDGTFKHDFAVFDKYLDLVAKHSGKPCPLRLNCWGTVDSKGVVNTCVKTVSVLNPDTGRLDPMEQPLFGSDESFLFWQPVIDEALKKLSVRGWMDATAFGHNSYCWSPAPKTVDVARKLWPEGVWAYTAHNGQLGSSFKGTEKDVRMPVKYSVGVWTEGQLAPRGYRALLKPRPGVWSNTARTRHRDYSPLAIHRNLPEEMIQRGQDGVGDFGGDMFPIKSEKDNHYYMLGCGRGTGGPESSTRAILAPGPDGAIATERFEAFREGTELSEAILFLEKTLLDKKIGGELEQKVTRYLDERGDMFIKYWYARGLAYINRWAPAGLTERDAELLALCAEVVKATEAK